MIFRNEKRQKKCNKTVVVVQYQIASRKVANNIIEIPFEFQILKCKHVSFARAPNTLSGNALLMAFVFVHQTIELFI